MQRAGQVSWLRVNIKVCQCMATEPAEGGASWNVPWILSSAAHETASVAATQRNPVSSAKDLQAVTNRRLFQDKKKNGLTVTHEESASPMNVNCST